MADRELGFQGMLLAGMDPSQAYAEVRKAAQHPASQAIFAALRETAEGRDALACSARRWAAYGFPPPWEPDPDSVG